MTSEERRLARLERGRYNAAKREALKSYPPRRNGESDAERLRTLLSLLDTTNAWHHDFALLELEQILKSLRSDQWTGAATALAEAIVSGAPEARRTAAKWLPAYRSPNDVHALVTALSDDLADVRAGAIEALGVRAAPTAFDPVLTRLEDIDRGVARVAIHALPNLDSTRALPHLLRLAAAREWKTRYTALLALRDYTDPVVLEAARRYAFDPKPQVRDAAKLILASFDLRRRGLL